MDDRTYQGELSKNIFLGIYSDLWNRGKEVSPRGQLVKEIEDYSFTLPPYVRFQSFLHRNFKLDYLKREFLWYLRGDRSDQSIIQHAKIWGDVMNDDGSFNSNYGQYLFVEGGFATVCETLADDRDSRRASAVILGSEHLYPTNRDVPCTYALNFRIRGDRLNMSVHMRSQDAWFGMGNDIPTFSFIHEMALAILRDDEIYPELKLGNYHHSVDSFHVYARHFDKIQQLIADPQYTIIDCPRIERSMEIIDLLDRVPEHEGQFAKWLREVERTS